MDKDGFISSIKESDIKEGQMKGVRLKGRAILLIRKNEQIYGLSNLCPHAGCSFEGGILNGYLLMCPCHGWKFDIRNGQYEENKETTLTTYTCKIENGRVYIKLQDNV